MHVNLILEIRHGRNTVYSVINNGIARLLASAYFPAMTVASVVRRPGGCCPSRRSSSAGASSETASQRDR